MKIVKRNSPNQSGRNGYKPEIIVCHITEGNYEGAVSWLCNKTSGASSHFVVSRKGEVSQLVDIKNMAWVNGTSTEASDKRYYGKSSLKSVRDKKTNANYYTIGIETEGFSSVTKGGLTEVQKQGVVELIKQIQSEVKRTYNIEIPSDREHIVGHNEITPLTKPNCPGKLFPFDEIIKELKKGEEEMIERSKFQIDGKVYEMDRILKEDTNYIKVSDLREAGFEIGYNAEKKLPLIKSPKN